MQQRRSDGGVEWLFPLNSIGFLGLSSFTWSHHAPERLWFASACGAALFLADSISRAILRPPSTFDESDDLIKRLRFGSFEGSVVLSAVLAGMGVIGRVPGVWINAALAAEAEIIYLAGVRFQSRFLRACGATAFAFSLGRLFTLDFPGSKAIVLGHSTWNWTPVLVFHAVLFYINRAVRRSGVFFSSLAAALMAFALAAELPNEFVGMAWIVFGSALLELGFLKRTFEFRGQAYALLTAGIVVASMAVLVYPHDPWRGLAISLAVVYFCALRSRSVSGEIVSNPERETLAGGTIAATAAAFPCCCFGERYRWNISLCPGLDSRLFFSIRQPAPAAGFTAYARSRDVRGGSRHDNNAHERFCEIPGAACFVDVF